MQIWQTSRVEVNTKQLILLLPFPLPLSLPPLPLCNSTQLPQADPQNFEPQPARARRMTLPNPTIYKDYDDEDDEAEPTSSGAAKGASEDDGGTSAEAGSEQHQRRPATESRSQQASGQVNPRTQRRESRVENLLLLGKKRKSGFGLSNNSAKTEQQQSDQQHRSSVQHHDQLLYSESLSGHQKHQARTIEHSVSNQQPTTSSSALRGRKSIGSQVEVPHTSRLARLRKGSIAQVSISGVMRLSHKLSIKKRHSNLSSSNVPASSSPSSAWRRKDGGNKSAGSNKHHAIISRQQSMATTVVGISDKDPMEVGQQILNAYLVEQRQRELEQEQERLKEEERKRKAAEENKRQHSTTSSEQNLPAGQQQAQIKQQPIVKVSSTRKSFRDFKHISRRIFMRHSSSKVLVPNLTSNTPTTTSTDSPTSSAHGQQQAVLGQQSWDVSSYKSDKDKRRNLLKIKRSETVFETTQTGSNPASQQR